MPEKPAPPPPLNLQAGETDKFKELSAVTRSLMDILRSGTPTRASDMAMAAHAALDRSIAFNPPPQKPACAKGCGFCCRVYVSASAPEVFALVRAIRALPPDHFARMRERIRTAAAAVTEHWSANHRITQQCPLLEDNACSLYAVRPDPCRGVVSYSAKACEISIAALPEGRDEPVPKAQEPRALRALHTHTFWAALKSAGLPYATYSLNHALDRVLDLGEDAEARWLAGEDIFCGVQQDTTLVGWARTQVEATMDALIGGATGDSGTGRAVSEATPLGPLTMRPETSADEEFRLALFAQSRPDLALLPEPVRASIVPMQFRAQIAGYRAQFPAARYEILERDGERVGRLIYDRSQNALHLIDIALLPALRNRGLGTAVLRALMNEARAAGVAMRLVVADGNPAARRLYERLGFVALERHLTDTMMEWAT